MNKKNGVLSEVTNDDLILLERNPKEFWKDIGVIGYNAFALADKLTSIDIPGTVRIIKDRAFLGCNSLEKVTLNSGLSSIGARVFGDSPLEEIEIPSSISSIASSAFAYNESLKRVKLNDGLVRIAKSAFYGCISLEEINFPKTLTVIDDEAFCECKSLKTVILNDGIGVIGERAFSNTKKLKNVYLPATLDYLEEGAFKGSAIEKIDVPCRVDILNKDVFTDCTNLKEVNLHSGLKKIVDYPFRGCNSLEYIKIPGTVRSLKGCSFAGCFELKRVELEEGVYDIDGAFSNNRSLEEITLPKSVKTICKYAFNECRNLKKVTLKEGLDSIEDYAFNHCDEMSLLEVPNGVNYVSDKIFGIDYNSLNIAVLDSLDIIISKHSLENVEAIFTCNGLSGNSNLIDGLNDVMTNEEIERNLFKKDLVTRLDGERRELYESMMKKTIEEIFSYKLNEKELVAIAYSLKDDLSMIKDKDESEYSDEEIKKIALYNELVQSTLGKYLAKSSRVSNIRHLNWKISNIDGNKRK